MVHSLSLNKMVAIMVMESDVGFLSHTQVGLNSDITVQESHIHANLHCGTVAEFLS